MFCGKCGQEVKDNQKFCTNCGNRIVEEQVNLNSVETVVEEAGKDGAANKKKKILIISIASVISVILIAGICLGVYLVKDFKAWEQEEYGSNQQEYTEKETDSNDEDDEMNEPEEDATSKKELSEEEISEIYEAYDAFLEKFNGEEDFGCDLIYVNNDDIPELTYYGIEAGVGLYTYSFETKQVVEIFESGYSGYFGYRERSGYVLTGNGMHTTVPKDYVFLGDDGSIKALESACAEYYTSDEGYINCEINGKEVTAEEFEAFDNLYGQMTYVTPQYTSLADAFKAIQ